MEAKKNSPVSARVYLYDKNAVVQKVTYIYDDGSESEPLKRTVHAGMFQDTVLFGDELQIRFYLGNGMAPTENLGVFYPKFSVKNLFILQIILSNILTDPTETTILKSISPACGRSCNSRDSSFDLEHRCRLLGRSCSQSFCFKAKTVIPSDDG